MKNVSRITPTRSTPYPPPATTADQRQPETSESAAATPRLSAHEAQVILIALMVPTMMTILNQSMFGVALPAVRDDFQMPADLASWVVTVYNLPFMMLMPFYGRLGDGLGKRRLMLAGIVIFGVGSAITWAAADLRLLLIGRAIQGIGSAGMVPLGLAILAGIFPARERGKALGTWNSIGPITGIIAPLSAGFMIDHWGWRTIFGPAAVAAVVAFFVVRRWIPAGVGRSRPDFFQTFDWGGVILMSGMLTALLFYLSSRPITGVDPLRDWRLLAATLLFGVGFYYWERKHPNPFVSLTILANKTFNQASFCSGIRMFTMSAIGFVIPLYLVDIHQVNAVSTGTILMIHAGALLVTLRLGGQAADRWGSRWPATIGSTTQVLVMLYMAFLPANTSLWVITAGLIVHGLGAGLGLAALHRAAMGNIPDNQAGMAAGLYSMIRFAGSTLGPALCGIVLQNNLDRLMLPAAAYQTVFFVVAGVACLGILIGLGLRD